ncbi:MAG: DUF4369 domain-containing protein, partial [Paludibacteraceae bacterium]|nr:DUF4369 domain-containing protein [Paludibacteraceae bacterium]
MKYRILLVCSMCLFALSLWANSTYAIKVQAPQLKENVLYLGQYYMGKLYTQDSIRIDKKGKGVFTAQKTLPQGMYVLYLKSGNYADLLIGDDQNFSIKIDTLQMAKNLQIT